MPEKKQILGYIHSTESFGAVDGPGIRFVVFCKAVRCVVNTVITRRRGIW